MQTLDSNRRKIIIRDYYKKELIYTNSFFIDEITTININNDNDDLSKHKIYIKLQDNYYNYFYLYSDEIIVYFLDTNEKMIMSKDNLEEIINKIYGITL